MRFLLLTFLFLIRCNKPAHEQEYVVEENNSQKIDLQSYRDSLKS